ncbi:DUF7482 domain-containing protein [Marinomonas transparens]|uniref:DUF7482 domain-containing protein n=1 Tax=Marinomonas transparens TaxID=2795388 RepID=A0A934JL41_9GAMM|nr:hypothetical protein [Marinomonas transparens]MBJ7536069.1 hypothetical protein [Marinomonas transparens]
MLGRLFLALVAVVLLASCANYSTQDIQVQERQVSLPLLRGWHNGEEVRYITTDVSDRKMAQSMGANYAPRLRDAIPRYPKPPQVKTILERVYAFPNGEQASNVFASVPSPLGYLSEDRRYSPVWLMYQVTWKDSNKASSLTSEEAVLEAEDEGLVIIKRTNIVVNCPVIPFDPSLNRK